MAIETEADEPLPDERAVIEERAELLADEDEILEVEAFLERL